MSQSPSHDDASHDLPHEGPIKTPRQLIVTVVLSFVVPIIVIILLVNYVAFGTKKSPGSDALGPQAVAQRIQPVGSVQLKDANAPVVLRTGEEVYKGQCTACHGAGLAGSPKTGDAAAWAPRIKTGYESLLNSALKGKGAMTAQGGGEYSDLEIGRAVVYLANQAGASFPEPAAPAASAASAPEAGASKP